MYYYSTVLQTIIICVTAKLFALCCSRFFILLLILLSKLFVPSKTLQINTIIHLVCITYPRIRSISNFKNILKILSILLFLQQTTV